MYGYYLIVNNDELNSAGKSFKSFSSVLESAFDQYKLILDNVSTNAVPSGEVHDALVLYSDYIVKVQEISDRIGEKFTKLISNYISEIEYADDYLYDAGISNTTRDFSDTEYEHLRSCLDDPWCSLTDSIGDWFYSKVINVVDFFKWDSAKACLQNCHCLLLDYNNETAQGLRTLFERVHAVDKKYGASIADGVGNDDSNTSHFAYVILTMCDLRDMLDEMAYIIDPRNGSFTVGAIEARLGNAYKELFKNFEKTMAIPEVGSKPTIEEIADFASQPWAALYFSHFFQATSMFVYDMGGWEAFLMIVFNMFDISKTVLFQESDYENYLTKKQLLSVLEDMANEYKYSGSDEQEVIDDCKTFLKYVKKYGKDIYKHMNEHRLDNGKLILDGRTIEARQYREFLDSLGGAEKILKYGDDAIEYISRLFTDYSKGLEILDSFENNYTGDEKVLNCVSEIRRLYNKEFGTWVEEGLKIVVDKGLDVALKNLSDAVPVVAVVNAIDEGIGIVGEITGLGSKARSMIEGLAYFNLQASSETAFKNALEKVQNADPNSEGYASLVEDLNNCFELNKKNMSKMFKAMAKASTGTKKSYYNYCAKRAETLSMRDTTCPDILSYEEFVALEPT